MTKWNEEKITLKNFTTATEYLRLCRKFILATINEKLGLF